MIQMSNIKQTKDGLIEKSSSRKIESPLDRSISRHLITDLLNTTHSLITIAVSREHKDVTLKEKCNDLSRYILDNYTDLSLSKNSDGI